MQRRGRMVMGVALLALAAWSVVPRLLHPISTDAVVNAEVVTLRAPVEGQLMVASGIAVGERVTTGQELAHIRPMRAETARRDALTLELAAQKRLASALEEEERTLAALDRDLARRGSAYRTAALDRSKLAHVEAKARARSAEAMQAKAAAELARKRLLFSKGLLAPPALDMAAAQLRAATADAEAARAETARLTSEQSAIGRGALVAGGNDDSPSSTHYRDELRVKRAGRRVESAQAEIRVTELTLQLRAEEDQSKRLAQAVVASPIEGVVWQRLAAEGDTLRAGDPVAGLVDCGALFLTAVLPKRFFAEIKAGDHATARLSGVDHRVKAIVQSVRAAAGAQANTTAAVTPTASEGKDVVVTLAVRDDRLGTRSDNLCQVGQHARVTFEAPVFMPMMETMAAGLMGGGAS
jgi:multidrug resistance efflux pump